MLYSSTRGKTEMVCSAHAIARGLADDGGLFIPNEIPTLSLAEICAMGDMPYQRRAAMILSRFLTDFTMAELEQSLEEAYSPEKFGLPQLPLVQVKEGISVLELWHGPTSAFKDVALQLLPHLLTLSIKKTGEMKKLVILVATSGDTGKAALEGFADVAGTEIIVFYPHGGVSDMQRLQMATTEGNNVHVVAVRGNFDDTQTGVKKLFGDAELAKLLDENGYGFSSANSINWGRLVPQIVYYFSAYADAVKAGHIRAGQEINFSVPTGNFGNILAGCLAKIMGLPVHKFICASNSNNVLADFFNTGIYDRRRELHKTTSPSMDILISSNLERLLYLYSDRDAAKTAALMEELNGKGEYRITKSLHESILRDFFGAWVDEVETKETIGNVFINENYLLDPHTAVAWRALDKYRLITSDERYSIVLSTASPFKFNGAVLNALKHGDEDYAQMEPFAALHLLEKESQQTIPENMLRLEEMPVLHDTVIDKEEMEAEVKKILGL